MLLIATDPPIPMYLSVLQIAVIPLIVSALGTFGAIWLNQKRTSRAARLQVRALLKVIYQALSTERYRARPKGLLWDNMFSSLPDKAFNDDVAKALDALELEALYEAAYSVRALSSQEPDTYRQRVYSAWSDVAAALYALGSGPFLIRVTLPELRADLDAIFDFVRERQVIADSCAPSLSRARIFERRESREELNR